MSEVQAQALGDRIRNLLKLVGAIGNIDFDKIAPIVNKIIEIVSDLFSGADAAGFTMDVDSNAVSIQSQLALSAEDEEALKGAGFDVSGILALIKLIIELFRALRPAPTA